MSDVRSLGRSKKKLRIILDFLIGGLDKRDKNI